MATSKASITKKTTAKPITKKSASKVSVKGAAVKTTTTAPVSRPVAKSTNAEIRREIENINQESRIEAVLQPTQSKNRGANNKSDTVKILAGISKKLDIIIDLLRFGKDV